MDLAVMLSQLRDAVGDPGPPLRSSGALDAFVAFLSSAPARAHARSFRVEDELADPYAGVVVGDGYATLRVAVAVAELVRLVSPALTGAALYVDTVADPSGAHRVYLRDEETYPGNPWMYLGSLESVLPWILHVTLTGEVGEPPRSPDDEWEAELTSGNAVLDRLLEEELPGLWQSGPRGGEHDSIDPSDRAPGRRRRACVAALSTVAETGRLALDLDPAGLSDAQRGFVAHLEELAASFA